VNDILGGKPADTAPANAAAGANTVAAAPAPPAPADTATPPPGPAPRASQVEPLKDLAAAQASQAPANPRVAKVTPPPPVSTPPRPHVPTIAIIAGGDDAVAAPAERAIEQALAKHGYHLVDQDMMPRVEHLLHGSRPNVGEILNVIAQRGNIDAVVVVHARSIGEQQITFYGQSDALITAQLSVTAYAVEGRRKLGSGWSEDVHFTAMSASEKAKEAVEPMLGEVEERLAEFRPARKG